MFDVFDKSGNQKDFEWLRSKYKCEFKDAGAGKKFKLVRVDETEGPAVFTVDVRAEDGKPINEQQVAFSWKQVNQLENAVDLTNSGAKSQWLSHALIQKTGNNGITGFGLGPGSVIKENGGPHILWVVSPSFKSDALARVGWLGSTDHAGPNRMTFQIVDEPGDKGGAMKIRITEDAVRLRSSPEFLDNNIVSLLPSGTIFTNARRQGDWWEVPNGFVHSSMAEEITFPPLPPPSNPTEPLSVPYRSQWDSDASNRTGDCGQTCVAMLAEWRGMNVVINDLRFQQLLSGISNASDLIKCLNSVGLSGRLVQQPVGQLPPLPAICLVWYGGFERNNVQDKKYVGWHWLVLLAHNATHVITHDPNYWAPRRKEGQHKHYSRAEWARTFVPFNTDSTTIAVVLS